MTHCTDFPQNVFFDTCVLKCVGMPIYLEALHCIILLKTTAYIHNSLGRVLAHVTVSHPSLPAVFLHWSHQCCHKTHQEEEDCPVPPKYKQLPELHKRIFSHKQLLWFYRSYFLCFRIITQDVPPSFQGSYHIEAEWKFLCTFSQSSMQQALQSAVLMIQPCPDLDTWLWSPE